MTREIKPDTNSKVYQKDYTELDTSKLKIAEFGRRKQTMYHIINYDVASLKNYEKTLNNKSMCGKEYLVEANGNYIYDFETSQRWVCAKCLYSLGFLKKQTESSFSHSGYYKYTNTYYFVAKEFKNTKLDDLYYHSMSERRIK
jgi:hypothetical protein